jgi:hypothetical protein
MIIFYETLDNINTQCCTSFDELPLNTTLIDCSYNNLTILPDFKNLEVLKYLHCSDNLLTSLPVFKSLNLELINCTYNNIIEINNCFELTNLKVIYCYNNKINNIPVFENVEIFDCHNNKITEFNNINGFKNITKLYCSHNLLTTLPDLHDLQNLKNINFSNNLLTTFPDIINLPNLEYIDCSHNLLTSLPEFKNLLNLSVINCSYNLLNSMPVWITLINLEIITLHNNPMEYIPPNIQRIIERNKNINSSIYYDKQSIHNHHIQLCLKSSIEYLFKDKPKITIDDMFKEIAEQIICIDVLLEYCKDETIHSILNVTFKDILFAVWSKIREHKHKEEIIKILNIEMLDAECKCFTGRITRLVNSLNYFDNNIKIEIDENEQMSNISRILYEKYPILSDYQRHLRIEFLERGYSEEQIKMWSNIE